jgi:hypothetical protein
MNKLMVTLIFLILLAGLAQAQPSSPTLDQASYSLEKGWNSVAFPSDEISFEDFKQKAEDNGCNLVDSDGNYLWKQDNQDWTKGNKVDHEEAYYVFTEFECSFVMDKEISEGTEFTIKDSETDRFVLKRIPSQLEFKEIIDECGLVENNEGYRTWVQTGGSPALDIDPEWEHPYEEDSFTSTQGVYIYPETDCSISIEEESSSDDSDTDNSQESSDLQSVENTVWERWTDESNVDATTGVNEDGDLIMRRKGCGKVYYEREYDEQTDINLYLEMKSDNWKGDIGVWYNDPDKEVDQGDLNFEGREIDKLSEVDFEGNIDYRTTEDIVQVGFSAGAASCNQVDEAELTVEKLE